MFPFHTPLHFINYTKFELAVRQDSLVIDETIYINIAEVAIEYWTFSNIQCLPSNIYFIILRIPFNKYHKRIRKITKGTICSVLIKKQSISSVEILNYFANHCGLKQKHIS